MPVPSMRTGSFAETVETRKEKETRKTKRAENMARVEAMPGRSPADKPQGMDIGHLCVPSPQVVRPLVHTRYLLQG